MKNFRHSIRVYSLWAWFTFLGVSAIGVGDSSSPWKILAYVAVMVGAAELANLADLIFRYTQLRLRESFKAASEE